MRWYRNVNFFLWFQGFFGALAVALALLSSPALAADETPYTPDAKELKKMSVFLSNFTELRFMNFDVQEGGGEGLHLGAAGAAADLIHFGIWHNYRNNFTRRVTPCAVKNCPHGSLTIEGKYVAASVKKYFDLNLKNQSVLDADPPYYFDGKAYHFEGADGEATYFAQVEKVFKRADGTLRMTGYLYNAEEKTERPATFEALAKTYTFDGKPTWAILALSTVWK